MKREESSPTKAWRQIASLIALLVCTIGVALAIYTMAIKWSTEFHGGGASGAILMAYFCRIMGIISSNSCQRAGGRQAEEIFAGRRSRVVLLFQLDYGRGNMLSSQVSAGMIWRPAARVRSNGRACYNQSAGK